MSDPLISASIIAYSISNNIPIITFQLKYPRFIHGELMTHRMFSRNASSSRAIPISKIIEQVQTNPAKPIHWGLNRPGMQAKEEIADIYDANYLWKYASESAWEAALSMEAIGLHKQVVNRILEPFQFMHTIVTATEWDNFFNLRLHPDAQPEIRELARVMQEAISKAVPNTLLEGDWHLPYILDKERDHLSLRDLQNVSVARCARVSYLNHDKSSPDVEKDLQLADKLLEAGHMSPFEHQASPMAHVKNIWSDPGQTHMDIQGNLWSGNFRGWIQYRQLL